MIENKQQYLAEWAERYKNDLLNDIMPFWLKYGFDRENGGVYTCLDRDGTLIDTTKSVWFQGRFGFTTAFAYNNIEKRPEFLEASKSCIDFIEAHCFDTDGHMFFEVMADGTPLRKRRYVFSEGFAAIAMSEYSIATGDDRYLEMHKKISDWTYAHFPDKEYGEWYGYLHRDGTVAQPAKGNIFKGPFHIPRMMTQAYILCKRIGQ